ncbi:hypothetical protein HOY80DRAFT_543446 [Tuber brumale]|nr:hypothetical protein HOY80DRAFT_543446 [Tuber brumale]
MERFPIRFPLFFSVPLIPFFSLEFHLAYLYIIPISFANSHGFVDIQRLFRMLCEYLFNIPIRPPFRGPRVSFSKCKEFGVTLAEL